MPRDATNQRITLVIPAAGGGTRLQSSAPKVLSEVNGRPMIEYLFDRYSRVASRFVLVVHPSFASQVKQHVTAVAANLDVTFAEQPSPTGMLDAILLASPAIDPPTPDRIWITWCDQIGVHPVTIERLSRISAEHAGAPVVMPTARQTTPYIHLERDSAGRISAIRQRREGDAMPAEGESDMGLFSLSPRAYFESLPRFGAAATQSHGTKERNFLPFLPWLTAQGEEVLTFPCTNELEAVGVNTPEDRNRLVPYLRELDFQ